MGAGVGAAGRDQVHALLRQRHLARRRHRALHAPPLGVRLGMPSLPAAASLAAATRGVACLASLLTAATDSVACIPMMTAATNSVACIPLRRPHCCRYGAWHLLLPHVMRLRRLRCDRCAAWQQLLHCGAGTALLPLLAAVARLDPLPPAPEPFPARLVLATGNAVLLHLLLVTPMATCVLAIATDSVACILRL
jgi:hypothetical protein